MAIGLSPELTSALMQAQQAKADLLNKRYGIDSSSLQGQQLPNLSQQGMFSMPYAPMYQPPPVDGISSAVQQISGGMDDAYTNRLLGALGLGNVSQYQVQQPMYQPMPFYGSPYGMYNPFMSGMFSPYMQQPMLTPDGREQFDPTNQGTSVAPAPDWMNNFFGDGSDYDTSDTSDTGFDPTGDGSDYYS